MKGWIFFILCLVIAAVDVLVPYLFLADRASFTASYLFWSLLTAATIIFSIIYTWRWGRGK